jgi:DNA-binding beta-propeller fold protein YncE
MFPNYENTLSVIDLNTFTEIKRIEVAINLHRVRADKYGNLWVASRGDYYNTPSKLFWVNTHTDQVEGELDIAVSNFFLSGDSLYTCSTEWSYVNMSNKITYGIVDVVKKQVVSRNFITDGTNAQIQIPYGIMVNPVTKDIYVTDAQNSVSPGTLYFLDKNGKQKGNVRTGDIPAHFAILYK